MCWRPTTERIRFCIIMTIFVYVVRSDIAVSRGFYADFPFVEYLNIFWNSKRKRGAGLLRRITLSREYLWDDAVSAQTNKNFKIIFYKVLFFHRLIRLQYSQLFIYLFWKMFFRRNRTLIIHNTRHIRARIKQYKCCNIVMYSF